MIKAEVKKTARRDWRGGSVFKRVLVALARDLGSVPAPTRVTSVIPVPENLLPFSGLCNNRYECGAHTYMQVKHTHTPKQNTRKWLLAILSLIGCHLQDITNSCHLLRPYYAPAMECVLTLLLSIWQCLREGLLPFCLFFF